MVENPLQTLRSQTSALSRFDFFQIIIRLRCALLSDPEKRRQKIRKHLQELGTLNFTTVQDLATSDEAIAQAVSEKEIWLRDHGRLSRVSLTDGMKKFDLMVPNDPHKDSRCSSKTEVNDCYCSFTPKGRL